jgi:hypothetical protein
VSAGDMSTVPASLESWAAQNRVTARPAAMLSARVAMHAAVRATQPAAAARGRRFHIVVPHLDGLLRHPLRLTAGSMAAASALVVAVGWNAGPGTPLHSIQLAQQDASLVLASATQAVDLRLQYAEGRLQAAAAGSDRHDNLEEAASLLAAVEKTLPPDHTDLVWQRWSRDEGVLAALQTSPAAGGRPNDTSGDGQGHDDGSALPSGSNDHGDGGGHDGNDGSGGSVAGGGPSPSTDDSAQRGSGKQAAPNSHGDGGTGGGGSSGGSSGGSPGDGADDEGGG